VGEDLESKFIDLEKKFAQMEFAVLFNGPYDQGNAILSIHAGTGGVDAMDWAGMLLRMYLRFAERHGFAAKIIDETPGAEAGIKSAVLEVSGRYAYGWLRSENGVHRLVRISPYDAEKMRHTSFALVEVLPETEESDKKIELKDDDLKIDVMRAGGHGGQSVNTTDSAVRITHLPTGLVVKCQNERSQLQNKNNALKILKAKLLKYQEEQAEEKLQEIKGEYRQAQWGNQARSYVLQPYKLVKDHRTSHETPDTDRILGGELDDFVEAYLKNKIEK
jgi:peptide chain release factor 2